MMLIEDCLGRCDRTAMVTTPNMNDGRDERIARYKDERRRQLAAQYGPRDTGVIRSTRASRLRTQANSDSLRSGRQEASKELDDTHHSDSLPVDNKKEKDKSYKRKSYLNRSLTAEPTPSPPGDIGARRRSSMVSTSVAAVSSPRNSQKPTSSKSPSSNSSSSSSPIPRSSQLVKRQLVSASQNKTTDRGSTPDSDGSCGSRLIKRTPTVSTSSPLLRQKAKSTESPESNGSLGRNSPSRLSAVMSLSKSTPSSPARQPHSILKKSSLDDSSSYQITPMPVSILKRKTSQDEVLPARCSSPVRFSETVVDRKGRGILKKHRSLDDPQVTRASPELPAAQNMTEDSKSILKRQQRRCSLEEVIRRNSSPEPQSILKRKTSREESELSSGSEPQGILKRKSSVPSSPCHISIAESVIQSVAESLCDLDVKPILKKKTSSTDEPNLDLIDVPRPILKKKSSSEEEEHPVKPILKTGKKSLDEEWEPPQRKLDGDIKPILKHSEESSPVLMRRPLQQSSPTALLNRRSLDPNVLYRRSKSPVLSDGDTQNVKTRPLSVAERVFNMESFMAIEGELTSVSRKNSFSPTPR